MCVFYYMGADASKIKCCLICTDMLIYSCARELARRRDQRPRLGQREKAGSMKLEQFDEMVQTMPYPIRSAWFTTDQTMRRRMAANTPEDIYRDNLLAILSYSLEGPEEEDEEDEEDLMDGDLEDQLENLLAEGDKEDAKLPRHCIDDLEKRYVVLSKLNGRYLTDMASDDPDEIDLMVEKMYTYLDDQIHREGHGLASITIFDREEDRDLSHLEMCLYPKPEASKFEQAMQEVH